MSNKTIKRLSIGDYELCLELWHEVEEGHEVAHISVRPVYKHLDVNIERINVPMNLLVQFDKFQDDCYWDYIDQVEGI